MRWAVPGTRRERVATAGRDGASGRSRNSAGGARFHEIAEACACTALRVGARQHVQVHARDAGLARGPRAQQTAQLRGERVRGRDAGGGTPGDGGDRAVLRRLREAREVFGRVFDDVEAQAIETSESDQQEGGAQACGPWRMQAARNRRDVTGVATNYTVLQPVADDAAEPLVDVRGGAARRYAAQHRDRGGRGACIGHVADAHANR